LRRLDDVVERCIGGGGPLEAAAKLVEKLGVDGWPLPSCWCCRVPGLKSVRERGELDRPTGSVSPRSSENCGVGVVDREA
jgi:hypothetical protein